MSKPQAVEMLYHAEVQKKIIQKPPKVLSSKELMGPFGRYRVENFQIYNTKKKQFLDTCKKYHKLNEENLFNNKKRLLEDYTNILECEFLEDEKKAENENEQDTKGRLLRQRSTRNIHQSKSFAGKSCTMEPWFIRHMILNKFIWAGRTIILKNRLLKVLEILKTVTDDDIEEYEKQYKPHLNVSYAEIFEKFV